MASDRRRSLADSATSEKTTAKASSRAAQTTPADARQKSPQPAALSVKPTAKAAQSPKAAAPKTVAPKDTIATPGKVPASKPTASDASKKVAAAAPVKAAPIASQIKATPPQAKSLPAKTTLAKSTPSASAADVKPTVAIPKPEKSATTASGKPAAKSGGFRPGLGKTLGSNKQVTLSDKPPRVLPPGSYVLENQIGFQLRRAHQRATTIFHDLMATFDVTPTQFAALAKVDDEGPISQNHLGRLTAMDPSTILGVVGRLQRQGLVHLRSTPGDARLTMIELTTDGQRKVADMKVAAANVSKATLAPLSPEDAKALTDLLSRIG